MLIQIISDIHTEFMKPHKRERILKELCGPNKSAKTLIIAGDLSESHLIKEAFDVFCNEFENVVYVSGNHEYYDHTRAEAIEYFEGCKQKFNNLHILNKETTEIDGQRFVGCTLWYPRTPYSVANFPNWSDSFNTKDGSQWILDEFESHKEFLQNNVQKNDVVITHMLPCEQAVSRRYYGDPSNCFFVGDVTSVIRENRPKVWVFGHTHDPMQFRLNDTNLYCNPKGYPTQSNGYKQTIIEV